MEKRIYGFFVAGILVLVSGCVATRNWVNEQISPLAGRVSSTEGQLGQMGERLAGAEGRIGQVDAKTEKALASLANLRLERRFVLDLRQGANFAFNSSALTEHAKKEIDSFFSDLKGDVEEMTRAVFLVAGHTDGIGSEDYNYELGKKRAEAVARYLITGKKMDPLRVFAVSYGKSAPLADNANKDGRSKNRRVEILVYKEAINSAASAASSTTGAETSMVDAERVSAR
jgi:OOP family OmpA-OmpF porin